jgi:tetratricopeptide (TPR) repeat protein
MFEDVGIFYSVLIALAALLVLVILVAVLRRCVCRSCIDKKREVRVRAEVDRAKQKDTTADVVQITNPLVFDPPGNEKKLLKSDPLLKSIMGIDHALDILRSCIYEGKENFKQKKLRTAHEHFKRGIGCAQYGPLQKLLKEDPEKFELLGQLHASRGLSYLLLDLSSFATHDARFLIRHFPLKWEGWYLSAEAFLKKEEYYKARAAVEKALACDFETLLDQQAVERLGETIKDLGRTWEAVEKLKEANVNWYTQLGGDAEMEYFETLFTNPNAEEKEKDEGKAQYTV